MERAMRQSAFALGTAAAIVALAAIAPPAVAAPSSLPLLLPLPAPLPAIKTMTVLTGLHLIGLCFGIGGAFMLDFWIIRWMRWGGMPQEVARMFHFISKVVTIGIALLWVSGIGFLCIYSADSPEKLSNPKLWAKIAIVAVVTINGLIIHSLVLPKVLRDVSRPLLEGFSKVSIGVFLVSGAVSGVSWISAFALGIMRELNGVVPARLILGVWLAAVLTASGGAWGAWLYFKSVTAIRRAPFLPPIETPYPASALSERMTKLVASWKDAAADRPAA